MVLTTSPCSVPNVMKIWEPKPPGTLWATPGPLRESIYLYLLPTVHVRPLCPVSFTVWHKECDDLHDSKFYPRWIGAVREIRKNVFRKRVPRWSWQRCFCALVGTLQHPLLFVHGECKVSDFLEFAVPCDMFLSA